MPIPNFITTTNEAEVIAWLKNRLDYNIATNKITKKFYCGNNISPGQAVFIGVDGRAYVFNITDSSCFKRYVGVCEEGATEHNACTIVTQGLVTTPNREYLSGEAYYIAASGYLSSTIDSRFVTQIALGVDENRIIIVGTGGGSGSSLITHNLLIDCGTYLAPTENVLIDAGNYM